MGRTTVPNFMSEVLVMVRGRITVIEPVPVVEADWAKTGEETAARTTKAAAAAKILVRHFGGSGEDDLMLSDKSGLDPSKSINFRSESSQKTRKLYSQT